MTKKDMILHTANRLFAHHGYSETTTAEISGAVGVAEGTLFYHFKSKESLFLAVLENVREQIEREFSDYEERHHFSHGMEMLEGAVAFYLYLSAKLEDGFLLLHRHFPYRMAMETPVCREHLEAIYNCLVDIFEKAVLRGREDRTMGDVPARKTALLIFTMVDGLARFRTYNLYDAGALVGELMSACRRMLAPGHPLEQERAC